MNMGRNAGLAISNHVGTSCRCSRTAPRRIHAARATRIPRLDKHRVAGGPSLQTNRSRYPLLPERGHSFLFSLARLGSPAPNSASLFASLPFTVIRQLLPSAQHQIGSALAGSSVFDVDTVLTLRMMIQGETCMSFRYRMGWSSISTRGLTCSILLLFPSLNLAVWLPQNR